MGSARDLPGPLLWSAEDELASCMPLVWICWCGHWEWLCFEISKRDHQIDPPKKNLKMLNIYSRLFKVHQLFAQYQMTIPRDLPSSFPESFFDARGFRDAGDGLGSASLSVSEASSRSFSPSSRIGLKRNLIELYVEPCPKSWATRL